MAALRFTLDDAVKAHDEWGCNCGPAALAAVCGLTLDEVRKHMGDFETKRYTNPTLMMHSLERIGREFSWKPVRERDGPGSAFLPKFGLARIQWTGPWTAPGANPKWSYRQTHWIGVNARAPDNVGVFDINAMNSGGWVALRDWATSVVPWILSECVPRGDGGWFVTHSVEVGHA